MIKQLLMLLAGILSSLLLTSCISIHDTTPYPLAWVPVQPPQPGGICPQIAGLYQDRGEESVPATTGRPCARMAGECASLSFSLLLDARRVNSSDPGIARDRVDQVRIKQPSAGEIEVTTLPGGNRQTLSMTDGDFSCNGGGLHLREKTAALLLLVANTRSADLRVFNVAGDGALIMRSEWNSVGHTTVIPVDVPGLEWVRWTRIDAATGGEPGGHVR